MTCYLPPFIKSRVAFFKPTSVWGGNGWRVHHRMDIWSQATYLGIVAPNVIFNIMFYSYQCFPNDPMSRNQLRQIHLVKASLTVLLDFWCPLVFTPSLHRLRCCMTVNVATCWQLADTTGDFIIWNINVYCLIQSIPSWTVWTVITCDEWSQVFFSWRKNRTD